MNRLEGKVHIVDDDVQMLKSLELLVRSVGLEAATYESGERFLEEYSSVFDQSECLLLDLCMRGMSGLQLQERIKTRGYSLPIIVLTAYGDVPTASAAFRGGALDFIAKPFSRTTLIERISEALSDQARCRQNQLHTKSMHDLLDALSRRERDVFTLLVAGKSAKEIGSEFGIDAKTVAKHRARVLEKLKVDNVPQLVHLAYRLGMVEEN